MISFDDLIDARADRHGFDNEIAIYKEGKLQLDYIFTSQN